MKSNLKSLPSTLDEAVDFLLDDISLNAEIGLLNTENADLMYLHFSFGSYIRNRLGLWSGNDALMKCCRVLSGNENLHEDDASMMILEALREKLKQTSSLGLSVTETGTLVKGKESN